MRELVATLALLLCAMVALPIAAQSQAARTSAATPAPGLTARAQDLIPLLRGADTYSTIFSPAFQQAIPKAQFAQYVAQLKAQGGVAEGVDSLVAATPYSATVQISYERMIATIEIAVDPAGEHRITGLRITGAQPRGDTLAKLEADFRKLPGASGFGIYALGADGVKPIAEWNAAAPAPLGSAFKLWMLAEASREVTAGERHWTDVIPIGKHSLPSGILQNWPEHAPITLQTAATLMISISDNTAADTMLTTLGRDKVGAMVAASGVAAPDKTLPVITTMEAFALKAPANADLGKAWAAAATPDSRARLLTDNRARLDATTIDPNMFGGKPLAINSIEWFASPRDMAHVLDWLRVHGDDTTRAILAVNPGIDAGTKARFDYVGFKGGSEPGVITLNFLVKDKAGKWFAVTGNWHNAAASVEDLTFVTLMNRALLLAGQ